MDAKCDDVKQTVKMLETCRQ